MVRRSRLFRDTASEVSDSTNDVTSQARLPAVYLQHLVESLKSLAERSAPSRANHVRVSKLDIAGTPDLDEWFLTFEAECDARGVAATDRLEALRLNLGLQATRDFQAAPVSAKSDYQSARDWMLHEFGPQAPLVHYHSLLSATKGIGGTVAVVSQRLSGLRHKYERAAIRLGEADRQLKDDAMVHFFFEALPPALAQRVLAVHRHSPLTYTAAVKLAAQYEKDAGSSAPSTDVALLVAQQRDYVEENRQLKEQVTALLAHLQGGSQRSPGNGAQPPRCTRCGKAGHHASKCRAASTRGPHGHGTTRTRPTGACHRCGKVGHFARECRAPMPLQSGGGNRPSASRNTAPPSSGPQQRYPNLTWPNTASAPADCPAATASR